jgi:actin-like ATPase involved in cell morphogenesis
MRTLQLESSPPSPTATGPILAVDLGTARTKVSDNTHWMLDVPTLLARDRRGDPAAGWDAWVAGVENERNTVVHHPIRGARIADPDLCVEFLQVLVPKLRRPMWGTAVVAVPSVASPRDTRELTSVLSAALGMIIVPVDTLAAGAFGAGLPLQRPEGVLVCDIGVGAVETGLVAADRDGVVRLVTRAGTALPTYDEHPSLFLDAVRSTLTRVLAQDPHADSGRNPDRPLHLIGGGALVPGIAEYLGDALDIPVQVPQDPRHAVIRGLPFGLRRKSTVI